MKSILGPMRRAILEFNQIQNGDKICVGVSGGKDSLVLLYALSEYRKFKDAKFDLVAVSIDQSNGNTNFDEVKELCKTIAVPYKVVNAPIFDVIFNLRKEKNPCSLCATMRRGALNNAAKEFGCNKVALAHHKDDLLQTFFLSLFHEGRLSTFLPVTYLSKMDLHVIRPLIYVSEQTISSVAKAFELPIVKNPCPINKKTQREEMKNLIAKIENEFPSSKELAFLAITHPERINLPGIGKIDTNINRKNSKI